jgi:chromosome segregation ATPase
MKATDLERISNKHGDAVEEVDKLTTQHSKMKDGLMDEHIRLVALKKKWAAHRELEKLEEKISGYLSKAAWAKYGECDQIYQDAVAHKSKLEERAQKRMAELTQAEEMATQPDTQHDALTTRIQELIAEGQEATELKQQLDQELKEAEQPRKALLRQLDRLQKSMKETNKKLSAAQKRLEAKRKEILDKLENSDEAKFTAMLQESETALAAEKAKSDEISECLGLSRREYEELEPKLESAKASVNNAEGHLRAISRRLEGLEGAGGDEFAQLGRNVKKVYTKVVALQKQGKFKGPVVGPIAKYMKVAPGKEAFAKVAELAMGRVLDKFIVTTDEDRKLLQNIRDEYGCQQDCGTYQVHIHARYNIPPPPAAGIETVASVFAVSNDLVFNVLGKSWNKPAAVPYQAG